MKWLYLWGSWTPSIKRVRKVFLHLSSFKGLGLHCQDFQRENWTLCLCYQFWWNVQKFCWCTQVFYCLSCYPAVMETMFSWLIMVTHGYFMVMFLYSIGTHAQECNHSVTKTWLTIVIIMVITSFLMINHSFLKKEYIQW